jgi:hypothetical protein
MKLEFCLKTKFISFNDDLQQVRIINKEKSSKLSSMTEFYDYKSSKGISYVKKYRHNWRDIINEVD